MRNEPLPGTPRARPHRWTSSRCGLLAAGAALALLTLPGCFQLGPATIPAARFDYAAAIASSSSRSTLVNLVKLRYAEVPVFLEVNQIVAGYTQEHSGSAGWRLLVPFNAGKNQADLGYNVSFTERPTITYSLMSGERFVKGFLTSVPPQTLFALVDSGWPVDLTLELVVTSVNGARNYHTTGGTMRPPDQAFVNFVTCLRELQTANAISVVAVSPVQTQAPSPTQVGNVELRFDLKGLPPDLVEKYRSAMTGIGLDPAVGRYEVLRALEPPRPNTLAVQTRSLIQIMISLASAVDVPEADLAAGVTVDLKAVPGDGDTDARAWIQRLFRVHSGLLAPLDAFVSVHHQGHSFWIDNRDYRSKATFAYLTILLSVTQSPEGAAPQLTISTN